MNAHLMEHGRVPCRGFADPEGEGLRQWKVDLPCHFDTSLSDPAPTFQSVPRSRVRIPEKKKKKKETVGKL